MVKIGEVTKGKEGSRKEGKKEGKEIFSFVKLYIYAIFICI